MRPKLGKIIKKSYAGKLTAKCYAPWLYRGETKDTYFNYRAYQTSFRNVDTYSAAKDESKQRLILGIESSFNDCCAAIV